jgi:hypothetical protein
MLPIEYREQEIEKLLINSMVYIFHQFIIYVTNHMLPRSNGLSYSFHIYVDYRIYLQCSIADMFYISCLTWEFLSYTVKPLGQRENGLIRQVTS